MWLGNAVTSSTLHAHPPSNETIDVFYIKTLQHVSVYIETIFRELKSVLG